MSFAQFRATCTELGDSLAKSCIALDWKGSLFRVQHLMFAALSASCEGRTDKYWEAIARASQAAQKVGIHRDLSSANDGFWDLGNEMRRRTLCNLYIFDR